MSSPLWAPSPQDIGRANLTAFIKAVNRANGKTGLGPPIQNFQGLYHWSVENPEPFWAAVAEMGGVLFHRPPEAVVRNFDRMPGAKWFPGAELNFAENLLRFSDGREALVSWNEHGRRSSLTYAQLRDQAARLALSFRKAGVQRGDRVAGYLPNIPETVVAMLAATSLGAIWSSCSPDFGLEGVVDRFGQIEPKVLLAADGYVYNGGAFDSLGTVAHVAERVPSIERVVIVPYLQSAPAVGSIRDASLYGDFLAPLGAVHPVFEPLPFDHPVYIMYSSGTTGPPKCIVHGAGGTLLQHLKELVLHTDLQRDDRIFYFTTCGWMMWNWLVSSLAVGATIVLYDGSPFAPDENQLFRMADQERITIFGTSAKFIAAAEKSGCEPARTFDLSSLRVMLSTGSPLAPESFDYVYSRVKKDVRLSSISGGTDIISCFALGNPLGPVYRGELQARGLGLKVEVYDEEGRSLPPGEKGELVCTQPFPAMPLGFWNDPKGEKYRAAYFERYPGVWHHGDYCELTGNGGIIIWGRSDTVLNPGGVRIGTAEIYRVVEQFPEVLEAVAVGQTWQGDVRVVLFLKMRPGCTLDDGLIDKVRREVRRQASPRHVPAKVIAIGDIPRTRNGKIAELAVRGAIENRPLKNRDALANPEALRLFENLPELRS
jgi:acetoacetyl-CoA synthetase